MRNSIADLLRIIAAMLVVIDHTHMLIGPHPLMNPFVGLGMPAVMIFFAASGFSIASESNRIQPGFADFLLRRLTRLWVVLIPALTLTLVLDLTGISLFGPTYGPHVGLSNVNAKDWIGPVSFFANAAFLNTIFAEPYGTNGALWSLSLEFWCYMAFYFRRTLWTPLILSAVIALYPLFMVLAGIWALGALSANTRANRYVAIASSSALAYFLFRGDLFSQWVHYSVVGSMTAAVLWTSKPWFNPAITYLSGSTYSLYAIHFPILVLFANMGTSVTHSLIVVLGSAFLFSRLTEAYTGDIRRFFSSFIPMRYARR